MATTTNYSWSTPDNTAYVKDGASSIRTLGSSVDTSLFSITGGKNVGLVYIGKTAFSAASSVTLDNVFTSAFDNYQVVLNITNGGTSVDLNMRFLKASDGSEETAASYTYANQVWNPGGTGSITGATGSTAFVAGYIGNEIGMNANITNPFATKHTGFTGFRIDTHDYMGMNHTNLKTSTSYRGIKITGAGTNMTGTIYVYGYKTS